MDAGLLSEQWMIRCGVRSLMAHIMALSIIDSYMLM
jgi:hypothetical protein